MKLTIIGCSGGTTSQYGACASYLIEADGFRLLVDCGSGSSLKLDEMGLGDTIDAVVISHFHFDHYSDAGILVHKRLINWKNHPKPLVFYGLNDPHLYELRWQPFALVREIFAKQKLVVGPFTIDCFAATHPIDALGFVISYHGSTIVYSGDGAYSDALVKASKNCDVLLCECSLYADTDGKRAGHMNAFDFAKLCELVKPQQAIATHLPIYGHHQQLLDTIRLKTTANVVLAKEKMEVELACN